MSSETVQPVIRLANPEDAAQACQVLIRSIREICGPDYGNEPTILDQWCANKTVANVTAWITNPDLYLIVAATPMLGIVGVGMLHRPLGRVALCYLIPEVLHQGVGKRLLAALETEAHTLGHSYVHLESSLTARDFYVRNGYQPNGEPTPGPITAIPLIKSLAPEQSKPISPYA